MTWALGLPIAERRLHCPKRSWDRRACIHPPGWDGLAVRHVASAMQRGFGEVLLRGAGRRDEADPSTVRGGGLALQVGA